MTTKERPILFSAPMVRAILDGRKTVTRRIVKPQPSQRMFGGLMQSDDWAWPYKGQPHRATISNKPNGPDGYASECPYGQPSDRLWVRETWRFADEDRIGYKADDSRGERCVEAKSLSDRYWNRPSGFAPLHWLPSIHMPRWASRINIEVTGVRVERLQDITEIDAQSEGVDWPNPDTDVVDGKTHPTCIDSFRLLWNKINGHDSWAANPWVWVVSFKHLTDSR